jgi:hypothetical protein
LRDLHRLALGENVRMPADQFVTDTSRHIGEVELAGLLGHARMEHDLKQQIAQFIAQSREITAPDGVGDLVGFLHRERRDCGEGLFAVPWTPIRCAQGTHQLQQRLQFIRRPAHACAPLTTSHRFMRIPAVAPQI